MRFDVRNHEIMMAVLLGIDDVLEEALKKPLSRDQAVSYLRRIKRVTINLDDLEDDELEDT